MAIASFVVAALALLLAAITYFLSDRRVKEANKAYRDAADAADRSATEAKRSADAALRSAEAAEQQLALARQDAEQYSNPWTIRRGEGSISRWLLTNNGREDALGVCVDTVDGIRRLTDAPFNVTINGGASEAFLASNTTRGSGDRLRVVWRRPSETEQRTWTSEFS